MRAPSIQAILRAKNWSGGTTVIIQLPVETEALEKVGDLWVRGKAENNQIIIEFDTRRDYHKIYRRRFFFAWIPNYGELWRAGEAISMAFVESAVDQVLSKRFVKKQ